MIDMKEQGHTGPYTWNIDPYMGHTGQENGAWSTGLKTRAHRPQNKGIVAHTQKALRPGTSATKLHTMRDRTQI